MGLIFSRFKKKRSLFQVLEQIEDKISSIENCRQQTEHKQRKVIGHLILYSVAVYIIGALIFYFYFFPASLRDRLFYIIPLLIFPLIILISKKMVTWYFKRQIINNEDKLFDLKAEKKQILDNVMEKETYKIAKEILEKFAPDQLKKNMQITPKLQFQPIKSSTPIVPVGVVEAQRHPVQARQPLKALPSAPANTINGGHLPQNVPLVRPILPLVRSNMDKFVEYLIGDGPNNRYALICQRCTAHNGMALKEEFLFIAFRCCYCGQFNPARKLRTQSPRLDNQATPPENQAIASLHLSNSETESEEENDQKDEALNSEDKYNSSKVKIEDNEYTDSLNEVNLKLHKGSALERQNISTNPEKTEAEKKID
uniref:Endoplasmic reticulum junction formation protein lunapark n=1 Tax=Clastoptera arizonana TaxID=38151 RepID=A0A1B6BWI0_9HEMI